MTGPLRDDFSSEAAEYLARLEKLISGPDAPDPGYLLRLARGVRESAARAGADTPERVAQRLEDAADSYASRAITWSAEFRDLARQTVGDLQILIRALNRWGPDEERRVRVALERWNELATADGGSRAAEVPKRGEPGGAVGSVSSPAAGDDPLLRALELRPRLDALLEEGAAGPALRSLVEELFGLLRLARSEDSGPR